MHPEHKTGKSQPQQQFNCDKRQREIKKDREGNETEQHRCIEKTADQFMQIVEMPVCEACPIWKLKQKQAGCDERPAWHQEHLGVEHIPSDGEVFNVINEDGYDEPCSYRWDGKCQITGHEISPEICKKCNQETAEETANLGQKAVNYANAIKRWIREGRPTRTAEEVKHIHETFCKPCKLYNPETESCKKCGCVASDSEFPLANKIKMATESCPMNLW